MGMGVLLPAALRRLAPLAILLVLCSASAPASAADRLTPRIVGGTGNPKSITEYPFQVSLENPGVSSPYLGHFCGGSVIDATHIVTAAHCVFSETTGQVTPPTSIRVLGGTAHLNKAGDPAYSDPPVKNVGVSATSFHPSYDPASNDYDAAVLTLASPVYTGPTPLLNGSTSIAPVPLAAFDPAAGSAVLVSGWGDIKAEPVNGPPSPIYPQDLRAAETHVVDNGLCNLNYGGGITPRMVCAGEESTGGIDSCSGDSGGPLVVQTSGPPPPAPANDVQVGIVSFGAGCAQPAFPGVYARVSQLRPFLVSNPPQAPRLTASPGLSGTASPGQTLACSSGGWTDAPGFVYQFARDLGGGAAVALTPRTPSNAYTVQSSDAGTNVFCQVRAINSGGYGEARTLPVAVLGGEPPPASPVSVPANLAPPRDRTSPVASIAAKSCSRGRCVVNVRVTDKVPSSGIRALQATLRWRTQASCVRRGRRTACTRTHTRHPTVKAIGGGRFLVSAGHLKRGSYTLFLLAVDKEGNRPRRATTVALKLR